VYECLSGRRFTGKTLDLGGGEKFNYDSVFHIDGVKETANNNRALEPTHLIDLNQHLPFETSVYDNVLSLNTLEHVHNDELAVRELMRVLKPGGCFFISVPFLYPVHSRYGDYHRHTATWWDRFFETLGLGKDANITIEPHVWDPLTTGLSQFIQLRTRFQKRIALLPGVIRHHGLAGNQLRLPDDVARNYAHCALAYSIYGTKPTP